MPISPKLLAALFVLVSVSVVVPARADSMRSPDARGDLDSRGAVVTGGDMMRRDTHDKDGRDFRLSILHSPANTFEFNSTRHHGKFVDSDSDDMPSVSGTTSPSDDSPVSTPEPPTGATLALGLGALAFVGFFRKFRT
jgi:hypothetical protein